MSIALSVLVLKLTFLQLNYTSGMLSGNLCADWQICSNLMDLQPNNVKECNVPRMNNIYLLQAIQYQTITRSLVLRYDILPKLMQYSLSLSPLSLATHPSLPLPRPLLHYIFRVILSI